MCLLPYPTTMSLLHTIFVATTDPLSLANVSVKSSQSPQQLTVSWMESGRGREYWVQLYAGESLSIIRNVSVPHGTTQVTLDSLVPGTQYRVEIVSRAGPHHISSQTAIGYTGTMLPPSVFSPRSNNLVKFAINTQPNAFVDIHTQTLCLLWFTV